MRKACFLKKSAVGSHYCDKHLNCSSSEEDSDADIERLNDKERAVYEQELRNTLVQKCDNFIDQGKDFV